MNSLKSQRQSQDLMYDETSTTEATVTRFLMLPAVLLLGTACNPVMLTTWGDDFDSGFDGADDYGYDDYGYSQARWVGRPDGSLSGDLSSVGNMQDLPADVSLRGDDYGVDVNITAYKPDGTWGMVAGWVPIDQPLAADQELPMTDNGIGCWGPESGMYDYDGPPQEGTMYVDQGEDGSLVITVDMLFDDGQHAVGVAIADPAEE